MEKADNEILCNINNQILNTIFLYFIHNPPKYIEKVALPLNLKCNKINKYLLSN